MKYFAAIISLLLLLTGAHSNLAIAFEYEYEYEDEAVTHSLIEAFYNLESVAARASNTRTPILVEFSTPWCDFCEALEQQVLVPLIRSGKYTDKIIIGKLEIDSYSSIIDFDGSSISTADFSARHRVDLYPTLVFFDAQGSELGQRIVGITVLDYVTQRLEVAIGKAVSQSGRLSGNQD